MPFVSRRAPLKLSPGEVEMLSALLHESGESHATLFPASLRCDVKTADRVGAACIQHSIEDGHSDSRFSLLARAAPRSQAGTDDGLVSAHRGFN